jgi:hypothetical protein
MWPCLKIYQKHGCSEIIRLILLEPNYILFERTSQCSQHICFRRKRINTYSKQHICFRTKRINTYSKQHICVRTKRLIRIRNSIFASEQKKINTFIWLWSSKCTFDWLLLTRVMLTPYGIVTVLYRYLMLPPLIRPHFHIKVIKVSQGGRINADHSTRLSRFVYWTHQYVFAKV